MKKKLYVKEIPDKVENGTLISINSNNINLFTHGIHKYPAKFIPQIPRWGIKKYTKLGDIVLDPFCGSGTTLVESLLLRRNAIGLEISPLAILITKVKTTSINSSLLKKVHSRLVNDIKKEKWSPLYWKPASKITLYKWFKPKVVKRLSIIKKSIDRIEDIDIKDFYTVIFSSIIRRVSNAEDQSQKVYISSRFPKKYVDPIEIFLRNADRQKERLIKFSNFISGNNFVKILKTQNFKINLESNSIDFIITSPPYINAIDYINVQKLEYAWIDRFDAIKLNKLRNYQMGSGKIQTSEWQQNLKTGIKSIDKIARKIRNKSKKHSYILTKFYIDLEKHLKEAYRVLKRNKRYCIVIGNNVIKGEFIPNNLLIKDLAKRVGFKFENEFSYLIKNRLLRIPRQGRGGDINIDNVIVFKK